MKKKKKKPSEEMGGGRKEWDLEGRGLREQQLGRLLLCYHRSSGSGKKVGKGERGAVAWLQRHARIWSQTKSSSSSGAVATSGGWRVRLGKGSFWFSGVRLRTPLLFFLFSLVCVCVCWLHGSNGPLPPSPVRRPEEEEKVVFFLCRTKEGEDRIIGTS